MVALRAPGRFCEWSSAAWEMQLDLKNRPSEAAYDIKFLGLFADDDARTMQKWC